MKMRSPFALNRVVQPTGIDCLHYPACAKLVCWMPQTIEVNGVVYRVGPEDARDISIPLRFDGPQPNAFGVEPATSTACEYGTLVGDTRRGGSCNFERVTLIPHCNGTHTECVGHITDERISVRDCLRDVLVPAVLISVEPETIESGDKLITRERLERALGKASKLLVRAEALVVRTLPNNDDKLSQTYDENNVPPYFTRGAMERIVALGVAHLLIDMPSIDRLFDDGKLLNHRIFWRVDEGSNKAVDTTRRDSTITELVYVPRHVPDGQYLLNLQIAPFEADAAPSRPVIFPLDRARSHRGKGGAGVGSSGRGTGSGGAERSISRRLRERS